MASSTSETSQPPYYLLLSQTQASVPPVAGPVPSTFIHPVIEYHYVDDPPQALLPRSLEESVIIVDYDGPSTVPVAQSLRSNLTVTGVKVSDAPGTAVAQDGEPIRNPKMYIIETFSGMDKHVGPESAHELDNPQYLLAQFKERNSLLKRAIDMPTSGLPTDGVKSQS